MRIWAEVERAVIFFKSRQAKPRPFLQHVDLDEEEPLVVAKGDVIARPVFFDQFALEQKRFGFAAHRVGLEIPNRLEHGPRLDVCHRTF